MDAEADGATAETPVGMYVMQNIFVIIFLIELCMRIRADGGHLRLLHRLGFDHGRLDPGQLGSRRPPGLRRAKDLPAPSPRPDCPAPARLQGALSPRGRPRLEHPSHSLGLRASRSVDVRRRPPDLPPHRELRRG